MKSCPNCGHTLGFFTFVMRYNSDSLIKHAKTAHKSEHACLKCKHKLWIYHNPFQFRNLLTQWLFASLLVSWAISILLVKPSLNLSFSQAVIFTGILLCVTVPVSLTLSKYMSASFKEEH